MPSRRRGRGTTDESDGRELNLQTLTTALAELKAEFQTQLETMERRLEARTANASAASAAPNNDIDSIESNGPPSLDIIDGSPGPGDNIKKYESFIRGSVIERFCGSEAKVDAPSWLKVFEAMAEELSHKQKRRALAAYLTNDALAWYAQEIAPAREMDWTEVRERFLARYGSATFPLLMAAEQRRLMANETVHHYAQDKMRLLRNAKLSMENALTMLTSGTPVSYQTSLLGLNPKTFDDWLRIAGSIENSRRQVKPPLRQFEQRPTPQRVNAMANDRRIERPRRDQSKPNTPCRFCEERGLKNQFHWHRECPNRAGAFYSEFEPTASATSEEMGAVPSNSVERGFKLAWRPALKLIYFDALVNDHKITAFLDTGSTVNVMSTTQAEDLNLNIDSSASISVNTVSGHTTSAGRLFAIVTIGRYERLLLIHVFDKFGTNLLLSGRDAGLFNVKVNLTTLQLRQINENDEEIVLCAVDSRLDIAVPIEPGVFARSKKRRWTDQPRVPLHSSPRERCPNKPPTISTTNT